MLVTQIQSAQAALLCLTQSPAGHIGPLVQGMTEEGLMKTHNFLPVERGDKGYVCVREISMCECVEARGGYHCSSLSLSTLLKQGLSLNSLFWG